MAINGYIAFERPISVLEYQRLRRTTNWPSLKDNQVKKALNRDLYSVVIVSENETIGMGRIIGDGAVYFYIQDVIVHPNWRKQGVGQLIMEHIESFLSRSIKEYGFIGLMAVEGVEQFYSSYGYIKRNDQCPGMYKEIKNRR